MFHSTTQDAAAQEEGVDLQRVAGHPEDREAGQSVISETVLHVDDQHLGVERLNIRFGAADERRIHLVGAVGELRDAGKLGGLHRRDRYLELE